ncbi:hypothetical protein [Burkholderia stabilis]
MNAQNWKVEGEEGDVWFEGTEQECRDYCSTYGYVYNAWICQKTLQVHGMRPNA